MIRVLRVVMIIWATISILLGLVYIFMPTQFADMVGFEHGPISTLYLLAMLGVTFVAIGAFLIIAARDPLKNILWVQFAIAWAVLAVAIEAYSIGRGFVSFAQIGTGVIIDSVFAVALLALYPWRAARSSQRIPAPKL